MPQFATQLTIEDAIRDRKRQERAQERSAKETQRQRKAATAGTPLLLDTAEEGSEVRHG
ncbi:hypothetical protein [Geothrix fuzhouensis]|uniref:hypothetical protein n=1 Tax=Geothrix fuzhouensis TaxID=2966451 RepID=UPI002148BCB4|nr:hypothetical protein [Geothrix fuzhouensis]